MSKHKILSNEFISEGVYTLKLSRESVDFTPGACASIMSRVYSIASTPIDDYLTFHIRRIDGGAVSDKLCNYKIGDTVQIDDVFQYFFPGKDCANHKYSFISTGTGLSPLASALQWYQHKPHTILAGARYLRDISFLSPYHTIGTENIALVASRDGVRQRVTDYLHLLPIEADHRYFICGLDAMIDDVSNYLCNNGIEFNQISTEQFFYTT